MSKVSPKIFIVIPNLNMGGSERTVILLSKKFIQHGIDVEILTMSKGPFFFTPPQNVPLRSPKHLSESRLLRFIQIVLFLRSYIKKEKPNAVLCMGYILYCLISTSFLKEKVFISWRRNPLRKRFESSPLLEGIYKLTHRLLENNVDGVITQTQFAKSYYEKRYSCQVTVIPNPVEVNQGFSDTVRKNIILNVGRFIKSKNQSSLVEYFSEIADVSWQLLFLGDGRLFEKVKKKAAVSKYNSQIQFHGKVKEIKGWYKKAAIFAFTSTSEGFPNALAEAMAHGCACISYDCKAGPADLIDDGVNGFLVPEGNHKLYKEKLALLMGDVELRIRFGNAAKEKMKQFDAEKITLRFMDFLLSDMAWQTGKT